jgi:hypothetical protein
MRKIFRTAMIRDEPIYIFSQTFQRFLRTLFYNQISIYWQNDNRNGKHPENGSSEMSCNDATIDTRIPWLLQY